MNWFLYDMDLRYERVKAKFGKDPLRIAKLKLECEKTFYYVA